MSSVCVCGRIPRLVGFEMAARDEFGETDWWDDAPGEVHAICVRAAYRFAEDSGA